MEKENRIKRKSTNKVFLHILILKGPGFFVYLKSGGRGRIPPPPPRISAAEQRKILKFGVSQYARADKIAIPKNQSVFELCKFVNYMHVFLFLIITDKMRHFRAFIYCFDIVVETFNIFLNKKRRNFLIFLMYFIVLWISYVFLCFCDLCILLFFYMELFEYWISINIAVVLTVMKANTAV